MTREKKLGILSRLLFWVGLAVAVMGIGGVFFHFPETGFLADAFLWKPFNSPYERMLMMVFLATGICMVLASGRPERHLLLVLFVILYGFLHGGVMLVDSFLRPMERTHLVGDVPMLIGIGLVFSIFMPWDDLKRSLE